MPISHHGVLRGRAKGVLHAAAGSPHDRILIESGGVKHRVAVNVRSQDGSEVLYLVDQDFRHEILRELFEAGPCYVDYFL